MGGGRGGEGRVGIQYSFLICDRSIHVHGNIESPLLLWFSTFIALTVPDQSCLLFLTDLAGSSS